MNLSIKFRIHTTVVFFSFGEFREDRAEAVRRKLALIARFHFDPAMIRIHPDNGDKLLFGAKVLGSNVGSEESIKNRLKKLAEVWKEADAITMVGSLQIQYLLLCWCFRQKIIHLQRTISPNLIGTYLEPGFTELEKLILNSILGRTDGIPPKTLGRPTTDPDIPEVKVIIWSFCFGGAK